MKLDTQKYITPVDRMDMECAKNAAEVLNEVSRTPLKSAGCELQNCVLVQSSNLQIQISLKS